MDEVDSKDQLEVTLISVPTRTALKNARKEVRHDIYCNRSVLLFICFRLWNSLVIG